MYHYLPMNKVEKIKYFSTLLGMIFIEITRGPLEIIAVMHAKIRPHKTAIVKMRKDQGLGWHNLLIILFGR